MLFLPTCAFSCFFSLKITVRGPETKRRHNYVVYISLLRAVILTLATINGGVRVQKFRIRALLAAEADS